MAFALSPQRAVGSAARSTGARVRGLATWVRKCSMSSKGRLLWALGEAISVPG